MHFQQARRYRDAARAGIARPNRALSTMRPAYITRIRSARPANHSQVMADQHQRHADFLAHGAQQIHDLRLHGHVERRGGFVGDHELGRHSRLIPIITR